MTGTKEGIPSIEVLKYGQDKKKYHIYTPYNITNQNHHNGEKFKVILSLLIFIRKFATN